MIKLLLLLFDYYQTHISESKGQLILKCSFGVFKLTKKTNESFVRIFDLATKKKSNQKK